MYLQAEAPVRHGVADSLLGAGGRVIPERSCGKTVSVVDGQLFPLAHWAHGGQALDEAEARVVEQVKLTVGSKGVRHLEGLERS